MIAEQIVEALLGGDEFDPKDEIGRMREVDPHAFDVPKLVDLLKDDFISGYLEAAYFTEEERLKEEYAEGGGDPKQFDGEWAPEALMKAHDDCRAFQQKYDALLAEAGEPSQNGQDFWYTRNHHGVGFWDRNYPEDIEDALTKAAHSFGEVYTYLGDDGLIYMQ